MIRASPRVRRASRTPRALVAILDEVFAQRDLAEWRTILRRGGSDVRRGALGGRDLRRCAVPTDRRAGALCRWQGPDRVQPRSIWTARRRWRRGARPRSGSIRRRCCRKRATREGISDGCGASACSASTGTYGTALMEAVVLGDGGPRHVATARVAPGASTTIADRNGVTPLEHAERRGYKAMVTAPR